MTTGIWVIARLAIALSVLSSALNAGGLPALALPPTNAQAAMPGETEPQAEREKSDPVLGGLADRSDGAVVAAESAVGSGVLLREIEQPATTVEAWIAQIEAALVQITDVQVEATEQGLQVVLETAEGELSVPETRTVGNALIADIPNAAIAQEFSQADPIAGIALVSVTGLPGDTVPGALRGRVRVAITGTDAPPVVEVRSEGQNLVFGVGIGIVAAGKEEAIELVVTGEPDEGYNPSSTSVGTRTDTPLRNIPQSIQVIPQQVIRDQQANRLTDVLENAPGVVVGGRSPRDPLNIFKIRGFDAFSDILLNGIQDRSILDIGFGSNIERVEVLRGPASVLFGQGGLGGRVNLVTKQPLSDPSYSVEASAGSYNFYSGAIDLSGPLNDSETVLYRLNASAETNESFIDFHEKQQYLIAPTLSWQISDSTKLTLEASYSLAEGPYDFGIPAQGSVLPNPNGEIPRNRSVSEPKLNDASNRALRVGYNLEHRFSDNWQARSVFQASLFRLRRNIVAPFGLQDDLRTLERGVEDFDYDETGYDLDNYVVGNLTTGSIEHELVAGFNLSRTDTNSDALFNDTTPLDVFNPVYGPVIGASVPDFDIENTSQQLGLYLQDQITLAENLKLLLGGRFDIANQESQDLIARTSDFKQAEAFSPRVGIVYQPIQPISLYASYGRSFNQATSQQSAALPEPERGTQYEIGVKADLTDQLTTTLAFYDLTRTNLSTSDPNDPQRTIQVGEQRSRGVEFDISGEILPGWNVIAGYAYTDSQITEDNDLPIGNLLNNVPRNAFNLWTTYEIQSGDLQGLGFGLGVLFYGDRQADLANTVELPSYVRTDAAIYYRREQFRIAINVKNLFDVDYFVSAQNVNRIIPSDPLTVQGTVSWQF